MPMFNLDSDEPEEMIIQITAGGAGEVGLVRRGGENVSVDVQKGERVTLWWSPERGGDAWGDEDG